MNKKKRLEQLKIDFKDKAIKKRLNIIGSTGSTVRLSAKDYFEIDQEVNQQMS